ncbi:MAG: hypothetical protein COA78_36675 [Blastopirellula sp.]|nr:MAG: hypothetical protein COA78_36675 [Blastopirellula sp.]
MNLLRKIRRRIAKLLYSKIVFDVYMFDLLNSNIPEQIVRSAEKLKIVFLHEISSDNISVLRRAEKLPGMEHEEIISLFANSNSLVLTFFNDRISHYAWIAKKERVVNDQTIISLSEDEAFIFKCFTIDCFRGNNYYSWTLGKILEQLKREQTKSVRIDTLSTNKASVKGVLKAGFSIERSFTYHNYLSIIKVCKVREDIRNCNL